MPEKPSVPMGLLLELLPKFRDEFAIDADRIYVMGLSMGGYGTWDMIQRHPEMFAAAVPICGGGDVTKAERIARLPVWAFHGDKDTVVPTSRSRDMIEACARPVVRRATRSRRASATASGMWPSATRNWRNGCLPATRGRKPLDDGHEPLFPENTFSNSASETDTSGQNAGLDM